MAPKQRGKTNENQQTVNMSEDGPTPTKRARHMLKSSTRLDHIDAVQTDSSETKRKQKREDKLQLMDLNDDCLLKIFEYLNAKKLCMIAETCTRAQALAQYTIRLKCHRLDLSIFPGYLNLRSGSKPVERFSWKETENFLCIFGSCIQSVIISRDRPNLNIRSANNESKKILTLIGSNCGKNLTELRLKNICIKAELLENAKQLFGSLKTLVLNGYSVGDGLCPSTENLEVLDVRFDDWKKSRSIDEPIIKFLNTAKALKRLSMNNIHSCLPCSIVNAISQSIHLEELVIDSEITAPHLLNWVALKNLKLLKIRSTQQSLKPLLDGFAEIDVAIEHLDLLFMDRFKYKGRIGQDFIESIVRLETIKVLKMGYSHLTEVQLLEIANNLTLLTELHIYDTTQEGLVEMLRNADKLSYLKICNQNFVLNIDTYNDMLKIIQSRPEHVKLTLKLDSYAVWRFDPNGTLRSNDKWLSVEKIVYS